MHAFLVTAWSCHFCMHPFPTPNTLFQPPDGSAISPTSQPPGPRPRYPLEGHTPQPTHDIHCQISASPPNDDRPNAYPCKVPINGSTTSPKHETQSETQSATSKGRPDTPFLGRKQTGDGEPAKPPGTPRGGDPSAHPEGRPRGRNPSAKTDSWRICYTAMTTTMRPSTPTNIIIPLTLWFRSHATPHMLTLPDQCNPSCDLS